MTSEARMAANRLNAMKSTGPRTRAGKAVVGLNNMKHGILSREVLVQGESKADLVGFGKRLRAQLAPVGELAHSSDETRDRQRRATVSALLGIAPKDEIEGMIAAQLLAAHNAGMECYRRAMLVEQTFEGYRENLNQANKLGRTYAVLLDALNRHRGKGQQKVTVEHVHVHEGGQAIVGNVESRGGGFAPKAKDQPHALAHAPGTTMPSADAPREPVPVARDEERPLPDARRTVAGRSEG